MNEWYFAGNFDVVNFPPYQVTGEHSGHLQKAPCDYLMWECSHDYLSPSGKSEEAKPVKQQITVSRRTRSLTSAQQALDAEARSGINAAPPGTGPLSKLAVLPPSSPSTQCARFQAPRAAGISKSTVQNFLSRAELSWSPNGKDKWRERSFLSSGASEKRKKLSFLKIHHSCHILWLFHSSQQLWELQLLNITSGN